MTDAMTDDQIRHWAEHNQSHSAAARGILRLLDDKMMLGVEIVGLQGQIRGHCERISAQSELLRQRACRTPITENPALDAPEEQTNPVYRPFDGSTGTPSHGVAGHKSEGTGS